MRTRALFAPAALLAPCLFSDAAVAAPRAIAPVARISSEFLRAAIDRNRQGLRRCHELALARNPRTAGRVVLRFVIQSTGRVRSAEVVSNETGDAALGECVVAQASSWVFPAMRGRGEVSVSYPFLFELEN